MKKFIILNSLLVSIALGTLGETCDDENAREVCIEERACCGWVILQEYLDSPEDPVSHDHLKRVCSGVQTGIMDNYPEELLPENANFSCTDPELTFF